MGELSKARRIELEREREWRRCSVDELYFIEKYVKIRVPGKGLVPFELRPAQKELLLSWQQNRYTIFLKARQIGFSTLVAAHELWQAYFHPDRFIVMLSRTERDAQKLLLKGKTAYKHLPAWMKERGPKSLDNNLQKMSFDNGSSVESLPSASDPARGEAVDEVVVDEWAFLPNAEEAWASIEPITDVGGRVIGGSTANGSGNFFHGFYLDAKSGKSTFKAIFFSWRAATGRDDAWYEAKKSSMLPWQLHQEYPNNDIECFIKSGNPVFDTDEIRDVHKPTPAQFRGFIQHDHRRPRQPTVLEAVDGPLRMWESPIAQHVYVIGADIAEGLEHGDYSSAHVIDTKTDMVVAKWHGHIAPDLFATVLADLGWYYNGALVGPEVNNHGLTTCVALRDMGYPNIYFRMSYDERSMKQHRKIGWRTQANTKPMMIDTLAKALRDEIKLLDEETIVELETYVRDADGKMHGSPFDDQVISLGIANMMRFHAFTPEYRKEQHQGLTMQALVDELDAAERHGGMKVGSANRR